MLCSRPTAMFALLLAACASMGCRSSGPVERSGQGPDDIEVEVRRIALAGVAADRDMEISGLAWYGEHLILLPQYPRRVAPGGDGALLVIPREALRGYLAGRTAEPLEATPVPITAPGLAERIPGLQGFEAIAFAGAQAFALIEAGVGDQMTGYLVKGQMAPDLSGLTLDTAELRAIPAGARVPNASEETIVLTADRVLAIYEANGPGVNPSPRAHVFDHDLRPLGTTPFPSIEYRVTDATSMDDSGRFWVINYFYPGERAEYRPAADPIAARYGVGRSHAGSEVVERLVEMRHGEGGVTLVDAPPVPLRLGPEGRNWEGLERLDGGLVVVTDMFPETILGFVPLPAARAAAHHRGR